MNKNLFSILAFAAVLLIAAYAVFALIRKPAPTYAPSSSQIEYNINSDLEELNSADLNGIDRNLDQLDRESSPI